MSPRDRILARRATFVAAALAALPIAAACSKTEEGIEAPTDQKKKTKPTPPADAGGDPVVCLSMPMEDTGTPEVTPIPCLSPPPADAGAHPKVCLSIAPPKRDAGPKMCLGPADPLAE